MSPHLSFDIQVEIIKRLPVKSLIRLRTVCKAWKSFIGSSDFIAGYDVRHDQSEHLLVRYEVEYGEESELKRVIIVDDDTFPQQKFAPTVSHLVQVTLTIGSSHGLLCSTGYLGGPHDFTVFATLWNPAIRKSIAVIVPYARPGMYNSIVGFGVCPDTKDPKLVKITYIDDPNKIESISCIPRQVMVFTLSSRKWTSLRSDKLPRKSIQFKHGSQAVIGQFIYWVAYDLIAFGDTFRPPCHLIMSFDLITNEFREVHLPHSLGNNYRLDLSVSSLRESLVVVEYDYMVEPGTDNWKQVCTVWIMELGDSKAFTKLFTISAPDALAFKFLGFRKNGEPIIIVADDYQDSNLPYALVVYEPCSEHIKELGIRGDKYSLSAISYTESLLLLDHDDGHIFKCGSVKR